MKLGLVLSGGGALGAFQAGVVEAVAAAGLRPTLFSGTSAGAINAAGLAIGVAPGTVSDLWRGLRARDVYRLRRDVSRLLVPRNLFRRGSLAQRLLDVVGWTYLYDTSPLRATLLRVLGADVLPVLPGRTLVLTAVDLANGDVVRFCNVAPPPPRVDPRHVVRDLDVDVVLSSAAIPLVFRNGTVDGRPFVDGGLLAQTPLAPALAYEPDAVIVVATSVEQRPAARAPQTLGDMVERLLDAVLGGSLRADLAHARTINELCRHDPGDPRKVVDLLLIEPTGVDLGGSLDFDPALAEQRIAAGRELGEQAITRWRAEGLLAD